jgi:hypothetical protein
MKIIALYRPSSEHARTVETFAHDFERQRGGVITLMSLDTVEGAEKANLYGIMQYPALLAIRDDGQLMKDWQGERLPLMDEVAAYLHQ